MRHFMHTIRVGGMVMVRSYGGSHDSVNRHLQIADALDGREGHRCLQLDSPEISGEGRSHPQALLCFIGR